MNNTLKENMARSIFMMAAALSIVAVLIICIFIFSNGVPAIKEVGLFHFLFGISWDPEHGLYGIFPMIIGTLVVTAGALVFGVPLGILCAVFLVFYCPKKLRPKVNVIVNMMAGIPSVVYGFFGLVVLVPFIQTMTRTNGMGVLSASVLLAVMILPTIISVSQTALSSVDKSYYEGARALGASHDRTVFRVMLPAAKSGILCAVILGLGRAVGETMAVMMVAGNQAIIPFGIFSGTRTLTSHIAMEMGYATDLHRQALIATAVVLFGFILIMNGIMTLVKRRMCHE